MRAEVTIFTSTRDNTGDAERLGFTAIMGDDRIAMRPLRASVDFC
jgi:hypothetical protein